MVEVTGNYKKLNIHMCIYNLSTTLITLINAIKTSQLKTLLFILSSIPAESMVDWSDNPIFNQNTIILQSKEYENDLRFYN